MLKVIYLHAAGESHINAIKYIFDVLLLLAQGAHKDVSYFEDFFSRHRVPRKVYEYVIIEVLPLSRSYAIIYIQL